MDDLKLYGKSENQVDILVQSVRVVSEDVEWNLEYKNVQSWSWRGGNLSSQRELSSQLKNCMIWAVNDGDVDAYKYLRVLEGDEIKHTRWKEELRRITFVKYREYLSLKWMVGIYNGPRNQLQSSGSSVICSRNGGVDKNIRATDCG